MINILGFVGHVTSLTTTWLCHYNAKTVIVDCAGVGNMACSNKMLFSNTRTEYNIIFMCRITLFSFGFFFLTTEKCKNHC